MAIRLGGGAIREIRTLFDWGAMGSWTDGQILGQFLSGGEGSEPALRLLIQRHGPMVLGVCRRILGDEEAAEDAFQATFLVLVRKAERLRGCPVLAGWIYGVALRVARKDRARTARRRVVERRAAVARSEWSDDEVERAELRSVIDEEVGLLPERYRLPMILCYMEGLRHEEVARRLGCPVGTVESRLSRARERLRARLTRRGLAPSTSALGLVLSPADASASVALPAIAERTVEAAINLSALRVGVVAAIARRLGAGILGISPSSQAGLVASAMLVGAGLVAMGYSAIGEGGGPNRGEAPAVGMSTAGEPRPGPSGVGAESPDDPPPQEPPRPAPRPESPDDVPILRAALGVQADPANPPTREALKPTRGSVAYAPPLSDITIDGQLEDWPAAIPRYPIDKLLRIDAFGAGGLEDANLWTSPDLSAAFSVGYDPKEQLVYLAVVVRDDQVVIGHAGPLETDALEVYVDGLHTDRRIPVPPTGEEFDNLDPGIVPVQQYVAIPGKGMIYGKRQATNPVLIHGSTKQTRTRMAYTRKGDVTIYEWAIQVFDRFPDKPTRLEPGKRIGFDLAVVDKDVPATTPRGLNEPVADRAAWIYWGPFYRGVKVLDAGSLGELILVK